MRLEESLRVPFPGDKQLPFIQFKGRPPLYDAMFEAASPTVMQQAVLEKR